MTDFFIRFGQLSWLYYALPCVVLAMIIRQWSIKNPIYRYSLGQMLLKASTPGLWRKRVFFMIRLITLLVLSLLLAKPQLVDSRSKIKSEGVDIMVVLDVSGSMRLTDFEDDPRSRLDVAKAEAVRFIEKRHNDAIGLVIFAQDALSRVPLTLDKSLLVSTVKSLDIGVINPEGTKLAMAIVTAVNRLKHSQAKSKIMIVLTDGEPTEDDLAPALAIEVAKKMGVKIYTIGIGGKEKKFVRDFFGRAIPIGVNKELLQMIAHETNGQFFMASDAHDMRAIYDTIDKLETSELETPIFSKYYDIFVPFILLAIGLLFLELILSSWVWFGI
jgi:Ca-activated chloride channel homolog